MLQRVNSFSSSSSRRTVLAFLVVADFIEGAT